MYFKLNIKSLYNNLIKNHSDSNFNCKLNILKNMRTELLNYIKEVDIIEKEVQFDKVKYLKSLFQPVQRTPEWYEARETMFTASSDVHAIITARKPDRLVAKKCGYDSKFTGNIYTWHGNKYEDIAISIYEKRYNREVWEFGLLRHQTIKVLGASPDGITTCGRMVEIKCPSGRKIDGKIKPVYFTQMQTQMEVCDLEVCDFFECNIIEYKNYDEYKKDKYDNDIDVLDILPMRFNKDFINLSNDRKTKHGLEKGMIGSYGDDPGNMKHIYPPFHLNSQDQYDWMLNKKKEMALKNINLNIEFWYLQTSSLNIVKRDRKWWEDNKITEKLYKTWELIEEARKTENGVDKYLSQKEYEKKYNIVDESHKVDDIIKEFTNNFFFDDEETPKKNKLKKIKKIKIKS
jgi:putative phage-type endonuclease